MVLSETRQSAALNSTSYHMNKRQNQVPTTATISAERAAILAQRTQLDQREQKLVADEVAAREANATKIKQAFDSLPTTITAILGREVSFAEALKLGVQHLKGKLNLSGARTNGANGAAIRKYRTPLTEDEKTKLRSVLVARQAVIDTGGTPPQTLSQISAQFKTTDATVNKWKAAWGLTRGSRA